MERYINQIVAIDTILENPPDAHYPSWFAKQIADLPAADVVEVVRGKWVKDTTFDLCGIDYYKCSVCGKEQQIKYPYCPICGAKMECNNENN